MDTKISSNLKVFNTKVGHRNVFTSKSFEYKNWSKPKDLLQNKIVNSKHFRNSFNITSSFDKNIVLLTNFIPPFRYQNNKLLK